jgi:hypothetical protein
MSYNYKQVQTTKNSTNIYKQVQTYTNYLFVLIGFFCAVCTCLYLFVTTCGKGINSQTPPKMPVLALQNGTYGPETMDNLTISDTEKLI